MSPSIFTPNNKIDSVAVIGNYLPRQCGIATFTTDLVQSLIKQESQCQFRAVVINDKLAGYDYEKEVYFEINQNNREEYHTAANFININQIDVVCLQHEFGIFGGPAGRYILELLQEVQMPIITTLHTVQVEPTKKQQIIMQQLVDLSDRLVVMSQNAVNILHTAYDIPKDQIAYIPHGIPDMPFVDPNYYKEKFGLMGRKVLLTFGLLSRNKGIEYVIEALPSVVKQFPDLTYIVLGATHPNVLASEGEVYRANLEKLVQKLNLEDHVIFKNKFVPFEELCEYLAATDIYVTPYTNEEQITSGTLAYATGTGKAVISSPYWYAKEMLEDGRGQLVPFKDADAIAKATLNLFEDNAKRHQMRKRAYDFNRNATWSEVARQYLELFHQVKQDYSLNPRPLPSSKVALQPTQAMELPSLKLNHLLSLTDDTGILQHAKYAIANRDHGYCTDDNARALIFALQAKQIFQATDIESAHLNTLGNRYLSFLLHAFNEENGRFRNFMGFARDWKELEGSEDSHGRALWALGTTVSLTSDNLHLPVASSLFMRGLEATESFSSRRAIAFSLIGIDGYLQTFSGNSKARRIGTLLASKLLSQFSSNVTDNWIWLEDKVTYSNAKIPHSLILTGRRLQNDKMLQMGLRSLEWLINEQTENGYLSIIGNDGWYLRNEHKANFDQQPLEANGLIDACISAYEITHNENWLNRAQLCFNWFLGYNDLKVPLYNEHTGGCKDGLESVKLNQNEGAESTLAWLLSLTSMYQLSKKETPDPVRTKTI